MLNCNLIIFSFLAFMAIWILAFADDASGMQMAHRSHVQAFCGPHVVAQLK